MAHSTLPLPVTLHVLVEEVEEDSVRLLILLLDVLILEVTTAQVLALA